MLHIIVYFSILVLRITISVLQFFGAYLIIQVILLKSQTIKQKFSFFLFAKMQLFSLRGPLGCGIRSVRVIPPSKVCTVCYVVMLARLCHCDEIGLPKPRLTISTGCADRPRRYNSNVDFKTHDQSVDICIY